MKKIDKLVLGSFIGPFIITFLVVVFILLNINMLKYFDDIVGKGLDWAVIGRLFFYFAIFTIPTAMPLAVLLSSLIAFGNLGEHFELTAIKSAGISLVRTLRPIFFFVLLLTGVAFWANNNLVPRAALEAYSLLYDIKQKKPALELHEGTFYDGIPGISIKVDKKFPDGQTFNDVVIYDHRKNEGNKEVTVADSGKMYTILNEQYMKLELFNGFNYTEGASNERELTGNRGHAESLTRSKFEKTQIVFDMSSFQLGNTEKKWFQGNRIMRNLSELNGDIDSLNNQVLQQRLQFYQNSGSYFYFFNKSETPKLPADLIAFQERKEAAEQEKRKIFYQGRYTSGQRNSADSIAAKNLASVGKDSMTSTKDSIAAPKKVSPPVDSMAVKKTDRQIERVKQTQKSDKPKTTRKKRSISKNALKMNPNKQRAITKTTESNPGNAPSVALPKKYYSDSTIIAKFDSIAALEPSREIIQNATNMARQAKSQVMQINNQSDTYSSELRIYIIQWHKIFASSLACIAMFLIGAPLGAIIKRGGLGMPFLVSILFFIIYYVLTMQGEKLAKQNLNIPTGIYAADAILFAIGLIFLRQARIDARLFETDFYAVLIDRFKKWRKNRREAGATLAPRL
jgi:lipopolysaccharide export system permease protein